MTFDALFTADISTVTFAIDASIDSAVRRDTVAGGGHMQNGSPPDDHLEGLEASYLRVTGLPNRLEVAIGGLEGAPFLRKDAAVRLERYRQSFARLQHENTILSARDSTTAELARQRGGSR